MTVAARGHGARARLGAGVAPVAYRWPDRTDSTFKITQTGTIFGREYALSLVVRS